MPLSASALDRVARPAFVARVEENAGPISTVFRGDGAYSGKLQKLEPKEADRRLALKLARGASRFEVSEGLRARTLAILPDVPPWTNTVDPALVATALESFLVQEVPANPPDFELLRPLGADAVVELVVERYGMHSRSGRAGAFLEGHGRMFALDGGALWSRSFRVDQLDGDAPHVDPFRVGKSPERFREAISGLIEVVATQLAADLNPSDRRSVPPAGEGDTDQRRKQPRVPSGVTPEGELPDPDDE